MDSATTKIRKKIFISAGIILLTGLLVVVYFSIDPEGNDYFPPCIFYKITGFKCPGCGTQRAVHSLLNLEFKQAFFYNPALFVAVPLVILLIYLEHFGGKNRFPRLHGYLSGTKFIITVLILIIAYWIGRNIT